ncbi:MAG TPA: formimidoylglutamate deiminase [Pyrinomonadaceae bacterium]|nr:formimidoylglutamate deiminase [Pyrinomonadaceae bacterium]
MNHPPHAWLPDLVYTGTGFKSDVTLATDPTGTFVRLGQQADGDETVRLKNRALLPGLVNAHSHAFQRVIRGRTEHRTKNSKDSFWTWREMMYSAATRLTPEDLYDASRMAFMEMALTGITTVGEFHYLHNQPDGSPYEDANLLASQVVRAARDVGLRIALLRVAYERGGHNLATDPRQARFVETSDRYFANVEKLLAELSGRSGEAWVGVAPHSVRAVSLAYLKTIVDFGNHHSLPIHMHVAEQPAEVSACIEEHGRSPVALLESEGLLSDRFTGVHVIHITPKAAAMLGKAKSMVCACPTTERNLGDGVVPVNVLFAEKVGVSLGTDSQIQIDLLEDARELEYHLRLQMLQRAVLSPADDENQAALAARLFYCATNNGARSLGLSGEWLRAGDVADFFTVDLEDPAIAGTSPESLLANIVFSLGRSAVKDVVIAGNRIVEDGKHFDQEEITKRFTALQQRLWS